MSDMCLPPSKDMAVRKNWSLNGLRVRENHFICVGSAINWPLFRLYPASDPELLGKTPAFHDS